MICKALFVVYATVMLSQSALGQCFGRMGAPAAYEGLAMDGAWMRRGGCGCGAMLPELTASYGGGLPISSSSCAAPTGLAVTSENIYEGPVAVGGNLPFLGTAAMEGVFPTAGASAISYGCGDGIVAITTEEPIGTAFGAGISPAAIGSGVLPSAASPWGYKGIPARGCGFGCGGAYAY